MRRKEVVAALERRSAMLVKDVMTSPVITVREDDPANRVAQLMVEHNIGCVIVSGGKGKPIGMITERDLAERVVAKNLQPSKVTAKEVMSSPLVTIDSDGTITDAARRMSLQNIRRLAVMHKGDLAGIISSKDILAVTPELIETIQEKARIENQIAAGEVEESSPQAGYCDSCGRWSDSLKEAEGSFLCEECRLELTGSEY